MNNVFLQGESRKIVLLFHGFTGSPEEMMELALTINRIGYNVLIPLLPGHGTSWRQLNKVQCSDYISFSEKILSAVKDKYSEIYLIGFSFGGTLALYLAEKYIIKKIILINTMILSTLSLILGKFASRVVPIFPSFPDIHKKLENPPFSYRVYPLKAVGSILDFINLARAHIKEVNSNIMVIYSIFDHIVSAKNSFYVFNKVSSKEKIIIPLANSFHMAILDYDKEEMYKKILSFLNF